MGRSRKIRWEAEPGSILYRYRRRNRLLGALFVLGLLALAGFYFFVEVRVDPTAMQAEIDAAAEFGRTRGIGSIEGTVDRAKYSTATMIVVRETGYEEPPEDLPPEVRMLRVLDGFATSPKGALASDGSYRVSEVASGPIRVELWQSIGATQPIEVLEIELAREETRTIDFR